MSDIPRLAVFPGSFDPLTLGHADVIARAAALFDRVVVAIGVNPAKQGWLPVDDRLRLIREVAAPLHNVAVDSFNGLLAAFVKTTGATAVVRGLRSAGEFDEEWQMALMNRHLHAGFETVFLTPAAEVSYISSRLVRQVATLGGSLDGLVPPAVADYLAARRTAAHTQQV